MNLSDFNALRHNRYKRKSLVHCARENEWFKLGSSFTVLGIDENFRKVFRESNMTLILKGGIEEYSKLKDIEWRKVVESLELGKGSDKHPLAGYVFQ